MARLTTIYTGERYGHWTVVSFAGLNVKRRGTYLCRCDCGNERVIAGSNLKNRTSKSCGDCGQRHNTLPPFMSLYNRLVADATRNGREVRLTFSDFLAFTKISECHYCGASVHWRQRGCAKFSACNLDRMHNELYYAVHNVVVCCVRCNRAKSNHFTYDEWVEIGKVIRSWTPHDRDVNSATYTLIVGVGRTHEGGSCHAA